MPWMGFEPTIAAGERPKTYALDRATTGTGKERDYRLQVFCAKDLLNDAVSNLICVVYRAKS